MGSADADVQARLLREAQVEAQRLLDATRTALAADRALLADDEARAVEAAVATLAAAIDGSDREAIQAAIEALAQGTDEFAARRMDRSIRTALAGRSIDEVIK